MISPICEILSRLKQAGMKLDTVYDIGAHRSTWSVEVKDVLPEARFHLFEANRRWADDLAQSGFPYTITCLSNPGRDAVEFFNGENSGASYYKENTGFYEGQKSVRVLCETLDSAAWRLDLPPPDLVKLDTQGSELDILSGAKIVFDHANLIQTELPIVAYNAGAPPLGDYLDFFRSFNFLPIALLSSMMLEGVLVQMDVLFMRREAKEKYIGPTTMLRL